MGVLFNGKGRGRLIKHRADDERVSSRRRNRHCQRYRRADWLSATVREQSMYAKYDGKFRCRPG